MSDKRLTVDAGCLDAARKQFCRDIGLDWENFLANPAQKCYICKTTYQEGTSYPGTPGARRYDRTDAFMKAIICMGQLFLSVDEQIYDWALETFGDGQPQWFCDYRNLRKIDEKLKEYGRRIKDTHVYFLPSVETVDWNREKDGGTDCRDREVCTLPVRWYEQQEILQFREKNRFTSAICFWPQQPDMLAVAAMRENVDEQAKMAGMAGVSADGEMLWQIGINVDEDYAGRGLGAGLVRLLQREVYLRGKVPFYGTSESHTISQTVGLKAGFAPAWTEIYVEKIPESEG